jgi:hypothetical protein
MKKQFLFIMTLLSFAFAANAQNFNTAVTVDNNGDVGQATQLVVVNGNPAISYYDVTNQDLMFCRATDANGTSWGTPVRVVSSGSVAAWNSLAMVNGYPAICFYDASSGDLKYVRATNTTGTTWGTVQTLVSSGDVGRNCFMMIVNSYPAICYYDLTNGDLEYIRATDVNGSAWSTPVVVSSSNDVGKWGVIAIVNGNPAISFYDLTNGDLKYVRANDASGATWGSAMTVQSSGDVGQYSNLIVTNGMPAISYYDVTNGDLKFVRATNTNGTTWGTPVTVTSNGDVGKYSSMPLLFGYPTIVYYDVTNQKVCFVRASDVNGSTWASPMYPDMTTNNGIYVPNISAVNGYPAISYYDATNGALKYMQLCNTWTGGTSTNWSTASNWAFGSTPTTIEPILIPNVTNDPVVSSSVTVGNMIMQSGSNITLNGSSVTFTESGTLANSGNITIGSGTLSLGGAVSGTGTISGTSSSKLSITAAVGTLYFNSSANTLSTLTLSSSGTATLGNALNIDATGVLTVNSGGVLTSNGNLTLKSSASGTARVAAGSSSGNYIVGNVTTETYIAGGRRAFRFICHPFSSSIPLTQLTDDIDITGSGGGNNGFDYQPGNPASAFWYNPTTGNGSTVYDVGWTAFTSAYGTGANSWDKCEAARVLIRGSKGQGLYAGSYTPNAVTLDMTGPLNQGDVTINLTKGSNTPFVLIGNPFMSPVNLLLTTRTSVGANIIVWDANQGTRGGYTSIPLLSSIILPPGASFVTTVLTNGTMTFPESSKTSSTALGLLKTTEAKPVQVELKMMDSTIFWDKMLVMFNDTAKATYDYADCLKMANPDISMYTFGKDDSILSIDCRKHADSQSIRMGLYVPAAKKYRFVLGEFNMVLGTRIYLLDKYTNNKQEITSGFEYWFDVTSDTATQGDNRFELVMEGKPTKVTTPTSVANASSNQSNEEVNGFEVVIAPNPAASAAKLKYKGATAKELHISIINMLGAVVASFDTTATEINLPVQNLQTGMYMVEVSNGKETVVEKLIKE